MLCYVVSTVCAWGRSQTNFPVGPFGQQRHHFNNRWGRGEDNRPIVESPGWREGEEVCMGGRGVYTVWGGEVCALYGEEKCVHCMGGEVCTLYGLEVKAAANVYTSFFICQANMDPDI